MAGLLRQQKLLSFASGLATAGAGYVATQRLIWRSAADLADVSPGPPPHAQNLQPALMWLGPHAKAFLVQKSNQAVDAATSISKPSAISRRKRFCDVPSRPKAGQAS
ncbi:hypothetical protein WJX84_005843 [Apatococcus fuscideae]|uniref:Uncharacterized protein n=1 Tax=Apatococcus fuscideae TaxID=2026836 RepID=A0AAW1T233_9CHLO